MNPKSNCSRCWSLLALPLLGILAWLTAGEAGAQNITLVPYLGVTSETQGETSIFVRRSGDLTAPVSFRFATADATAKAGVDYVATNGVVTLNPGEDHLRLLLRQIDNPKLDGDRGFRVVFSEPSAGAGFNDPYHPTDTTNLFTLDIGILDNELNGSNDPDFRPAVMATTRSYLGRFFLGPVPASGLLDAGKLWISGGPDGVARLNADGSLDSGFQLDDTLVGRQVEPLLALHDGSLLAIDSLNRPLIRLLPNGRRDAGFASTPNVIRAAEQADGRIILVSQSKPCCCAEDPVADVAHITRVRVDGLPDPSFQQGRIVTTNNFFGSPWTIEGLVLDAQLRILVAGRIHRYNDTETACVIRLHPDGSLDMSFKPSLKRGDGTPGHANDLALAGSGQIFVSGDFGAFHPEDGRYDPGLIRLREDGTMDTDFRAGPTDVATMVPEADGGVLLGPGGWDSSPFLIASRLNPDGSLDSSLKTGGLLGTPFESNGTRNVPIIQPGCYYCADSRPALITDGIGRILFAGPDVSPYFNSINGTRYAGLIRLDRNAADRRQFQADYLHSSYAWVPINEADPVARVRIFRTGDTSAAASVDFATVDDTAQAGRDYVAASGRVDFAPLEVEREIAVPLLDNSVVDGDRQFRVALRQPSAGYRVPTVHAPFTIRDDDFGFPPGSVRHLADGRVRLTLFNPPSCRPDGSSVPVILQASTELLHWMPITTNSTCERTLAFEETNAPTALRFYRAVEAP